MDRWTPPWTLTERVVNALVPGSLLWRRRAKKAYRKARRPELRLLPELVDPERTSVDVGANRGVFTYYLARLTQHVYAYEPHPKMFAILERTARHPRVTVSPAALSDRSGSATLYVPRRRDGGASNQRATLREALGADASAGRCTVETRRLDDEDVGDVGFIKIDVEGFELSVLEGARETLAAQRPTLLIEIDERWSGRPLRESLAFVQDLGFQGRFFADGRLRPLGDLDLAQGATPRDFVFVPQG